MDEYLKEAIELVRTQAALTPMTPEAINEAVKKIADGLRDIENAADGNVQSAQPGIAMDPSKAIKEASVICLECGKSFKVLTKKHLATHGLTPEEYRTKYGYKKGQPLATKGLQRARRKKMQEMKLWERRGEKAS